MIDKFKVKRQFTEILKDKMIFGAGIMSLGIFMGSVFNYLTQIFLGRFLSVEDYGTFNSLLSLTVIFSIPSASLISSVIKTVAALRIQKDFKTLTNIFWNISKFIFLSGLIISGLFLVFYQQIFDYLNISDKSLAVPFVLYIIFLLLNTVPRSYLQGLLRYKAFSAHAVFGPILRLALSMIFVIAGYRVSGAFFGLTLAVFFNLLLGIGLLKKNFAKGLVENTRKHYKKILSFGFTVLIIRASLTAISNVDLILVKHFFSPTDAGIYAGTVTIGKIILFGTGILGAVMFPIISDLYAKGSTYYKKFVLFFTAQLVLVIGGIAAFFLFPRFITVTMFGRAYIPAIEYLTKFSIFAGLFSMVSFVYQFLLAIEKTQSYLFLVFGLITQFILINFFHNTLMQVININIAVMFCVLISSLIYLKKFTLK